MKIFGGHCLLCNGDLEMLQVVNGAIHTRCISCNHISRPEIKSIKQNTVYSQFARKSVDVEYSRPNNQRKTISGTFRKVS